jgi:hypothetical protein
MHLPDVACDSDLADPVIERGVPEPALTAGTGVANPLWGARRILSRTSPENLTKVDV